MKDYITKKNQDPEKQKLYHEKRKINKSYRV